MEPNRCDRDAISAFLRDVTPPPGVEVQVYRRRLDDPNRWDYLEYVDSQEEIGVTSLEAAEPDDLQFLIPLSRVQRRWGGGKYQFRFRWRDEEGVREQKRSLNMAIPGQPKQKRR